MPHGRASSAVPVSVHPAGPRGRAATVVERGRGLRPSDLARRRPRGLPRRLGISGAPPRGPRRTGARRLGADRGAVVAADTPAILMGGAAALVVFWPFGDAEPRTRVRVFLPTVLMVLLAPRIAVPSLRAPLR